MWCSGVRWQRRVVLAVIDVEEHRAAAVSADAAQLCLCGLSGEALAYKGGEVFVDLRGYRGRVEVVLLLSRGSSSGHGGPASVTSEISRCL